MRQAMLFLVLVAAAAVVSSGCSTEHYVCVSGQTNWALEIDDAPLRDAPDGVRTLRGGYEVAEYRLNGDGPWTARVENLEATGGVNLWFYSKRRVPFSGGFSYSDCWATSEPHGVLIRRYDP